jgi:hypothetical protein
MGDILDKSFARTVRRFGSPLVPNSNHLSGNLLDRIEHALGTVSKIYSLYFTLIFNRSLWFYVPPIFLRRWVQHPSSIW